MNRFNLGFYSHSNHIDKFYDLFMNFLKQQIGKLSDFIKKIYFHCLSMSFLFSLSLSWGKITKTKIEKNTNNKITKLIIQLKWKPKICLKKKANSK